MLTPAKALFNMLFQLMLLFQIEAIHEKHVPSCFSIFLL